MPIEIELTLQEIRLGGYLGVDRQVSALKRKLKNSNGRYGAGNFEIHILGSLGEMAVAKALGMYYIPTIDTGNAPDVGKYQVRYTSTDPPVLIIRNSDKDEEVFICVSGEAPKMTVHGWMLASEAKNLKEYIKNPFGRGSAWFIPVNLLHPLGKIQKQIGDVDAGT